MKIIASTGNSDIASVYIAAFDNDKKIEMVESVQPPLPRNEKWVLIISSLFGCPVRCPMCDAGVQYRGILTKEELFDQIDFLVIKYFPDREIKVEKFKIQFARMGEPSFNPNVLKVLNEFSDRYKAPGFMPSISTVAPKTNAVFFESLIKIKNSRYQSGNFQLQFSIHTTDEKLREEIIPISKWDLNEISKYGERFFKTGDRKITLSFALAEDSPVDVNTLTRYFSPEKFLIKITPLNPTYSVEKNKMKSFIKSDADINSELIQTLKFAGFDVILSIGELEENNIGSNCGQYLQRHLLESKQIPHAYSYIIKDN
ncbi:radical SAM protein [Candidatus Dependentiae bacterium]|nr:radical SAM protein [Candidatus Dependentiae bacterium]